MRPAIGLLLASLSATALAHKPSESYLRLDVHDQPALEMDMALRDLEFAVGLDGNGDGTVTRGEVDTSLPRVSAYALARLSIRAGADECDLHQKSSAITEHSDDPYLMLTFEVKCPTQTDLRLHYSLFFELDATHRALVTYFEQERQVAAVLHDAKRVLQLPVSGTRATGEHALDFVRQGVWHIWIGLDHILFLVTLLLPVVLDRRDGHWCPVPRIDEAFLQLAKIVTAFTCAHSVTLTLAVLQIVTLPSRVVESAIAASVIVVALANLLPGLPAPRWRLAGLFGLVHGFGFATVLIDLGLPPVGLAQTLLAFNLGVELGQLALIALLLPACFALRRSDFYRRALLPAGSLAIAAIAAVWLAERAFEYRFLPV